MAEDEAPLSRQRLPLHSSTTIQKSEFWRWCFFSAAIAYLAELLCQFGSFTLEVAEQGILDTSAFTLAAWGLILTRSGRLVDQGPVSRRAILGALGLALPCALPGAESLIAALAILSIWLVLDRDVTSEGRQVGLLLALLAVEHVWRTPYLHALHTAVAYLDAQMVAWLASHTIGAMSAVGKLVGTETFRIDILVGCSSSLQLADVALGFVVVVVWFRGEFRRTDLPWLAGSLLASVSLTYVRLTVLASSEARYEWWHNGEGSSFYPMAALALSLLFPLLCCTLPSRHAVPAPAGRPA